MASKCEICGNKVEKLYTCKKCGRKVGRNCFHKAKGLCEICYNKGKKGESELKIPESAKPMSVSPGDIKK